MLTLPSAAQEHIERESRRLTICGVIEKNDGSTVMCTQHDEDIEIVSGDFEGIYFSTAAVTGSDIKSSSDLSVDNMEITGLISDGAVFTGFNVADIEAGLFDKAPFQTFLCQWDDPSAWQKVLRRGFLGEISRTAEGQFQAEWRGLLQYYQQQIGRVYGERCDVKRFGDARCKLDVEALAVVATVTSVTSRRRFDASLVPNDPQSLTYFDLGEATFTSGSNNGFLRQVKRGAAGGTNGQIDLWESMPYDVTIGDTFTLKPGCDRLFVTCQSYENQINFRGHGRWIPGIPSIIRAP